MELSELTKLGTEPIPGENPGGQSVQYDDDYKALRDEIAKMDSVEQEPVDWRKIVDTATDILGKRSKHLLVAAYFTLALFEEHDYAGLETGLAVCRDLVKNFWDVLEPPRQRGRIEAFYWLGERGGAAASGHKPGSSEKEALDSCGAIIDELTGVLTEKLDKDAPGLGDLRRTVRQYIKDFEAAARAAEAAKKKAAERAAAGQIEELKSPDDARKAFTRIRSMTKQICDFLRKTDSSDPVAYRMIRAVTWGPLKNLPPNTNGVTQIPAVAPELPARLADLHQKKDWANLVESSEAAFGQAIFWLDIHRWNVLGLTGLGATHADAAKAVTHEVATLVSRLSGLTELSFADGMPFASDETRIWIEKEVLTAGGGAGNGQSHAAGNRDGLPEGLPDAARDARKLASKGRLPDAIRLMQTGVSATSDRRSQFLWRLELAKLCLGAGQPVLAVPQLEDLESLIDRHHLEAWEPELCLSVYTALLSARRILLKDQRRATPELQQKTNTLHDRLCRLDAAAALALDGKK